MAVYSSGIETKRKFLLLAHQKLTEGSVSDLSVRELASESGYSASALYRHFESLEYLVIVASIRFLDGYVSEYAKLWDIEGDLLSSYVKGWRLFNHHAFARPDVYYRLFWGEYNHRFIEAVQEYYDLFPFSGTKKCPSYFYSLLFNADIYKRDFLALQQFTDGNQISEEDAKYLSRVSPLIVKGILSESMSMTQKERTRAEEECNILLEQSVERIISGH